MSKRGSGVNTYWCIACNLAFSLRFGVSPKRKRSGMRFCPSCGETADVTHYDQRPVKVVAPFVFWTTKEIQEIKEHALNGLTTSKISTAMSRTVPSVYHKLKELGLLKKHIRK